eukprot:2844780-Rhodomonas_salina.1
MQALASGQPRAWCDLYSEGCAAFAVNLETVSQAAAKENPTSQQAEDACRPGRPESASAWKRLCNGGV